MGHVEVQSKLYKKENPKVPSLKEKQEHMDKLVREVTRMHYLGL
jgi:hypothetical protein